MAFCGGSAPAFEHPAPALPACPHRPAAPDPHDLRPGHLHRFTELRLGRSQWVCRRWRGVRCRGRGAAAAGGNPCVPAPADDPYLALVPAEPIVRLARVGASTTIKVEAATNRPVAAWSVDAIDLTGRQARERYVEISLDTASVVADRTATLTIAVRKLPPNKVAVVGLRSTLRGQTHLWPVAVVTR